jgi:transposase
MMRGEDRQQSHMFSYVSAERRVPKDHPLRAIWVLSDAALQKLSGRFAELYSETGRPSIAPEKLLRALLLQVLYTIRSERLLMEELDYNLLFRWFVGLNVDDPVWDASTFSKNRDRLLEVAQLFFEEILRLAREHKLLSDEHFTVDGTMIEAWAGQKSFRPKGGKSKTSGSDDDPGNPTVDFRGEKRSNATHESTTDPEARLYKKAPGQQSRLCFLGHVLTENRNGLVVDARLTQATGTAEREAALEMIDGRRGTLGADKAYDVREFVSEVRASQLTPHVAQNDSNRRSAVDARTTRHEGYAISQRKRKRVEEVFGWLKTIGLMRKTRHRGTERIGWMFTFAAAAYNLVRIRNLIAATG